MVLGCWHFEWTIQSWWRLKHSVKTSASYFLSSSWWQITFLFQLCRNQLRSHWKIMMPLSHSFQSHRTMASSVQYSWFHMKSHNPYKARGIHSKIFTVIGCSTSIVAIATVSTLISVPVILGFVWKKYLSAVLLSSVPVILGFVWKKYLSAVLLYADHE